MVQTKSTYENTSSYTSCIFFQEQKETVNKIGRNSREEKKWKNGGHSPRSNNADDVHKKASQHHV